MKVNLNPKLSLLSTILVILVLILAVGAIIYFEPSLRMATIS